jgi:hypothetical protein
MDAEVRAYVERLGRVGVGAACQPSIPKGERSGLLTHIAMPESVS